MTDIYDSTYVVYFADEKSVPNNANYWTWSASSGAEVAEGRLILTFEHIVPNQDLTDKARAIGEIYASGIGNSVDEVVFVERQVTGHVPNHSRYHLESASSPL